MIETLFKDIVKELIAWWKRVWFAAKLKARLDMIEFDNRVAAELELKEKNKPIYIEHPIDPELQTGASKDLGGAMELRAPWYKSDGVVDSSNDN
jgi:hypothetical protein